MLIIYTSHSYKVETPSNSAIYHQGVGYNSLSEASALYLVIFLTPLGIIKAGIVITFRHDDSSNNDICMGPA